MMFQGNTKTIIIPKRGQSVNLSVYVPKSITPEAYQYLANPKKGFLNTIKLWIQDEKEPMCWDTYAKYGVPQPPKTVSKSGVQTPEDAQRQMNEALDAQRRAAAQSLQGIGVDINLANTDVPGLDEAAAEAASNRQHALEQANTEFDTGMSAEEAAAIAAMSDGDGEGEGDDAGEGDAGDDNVSYNSEPPTPRAGPRRGVGRRGAGNKNK